MVAVDSAELTVAVQDVRGVSVVDVNGELDLSTAGTLRRALAPLDLDSGISIVFDLSGVGFLDSSGMGVLVSVCRRTRESGGTFSVRCDDGVARRSLEIAGLVEFLGLNGNDSQGSPAGAAGSPAVHRHTNQF